MSARQPFMFGGSRPPSRLGQPAETENNGKDDKNDADATEVQPQNQNNSFPTLNLSSLTRKKSSASQQQNNSTQSNNANQQTRSSIENIIPPGVDAIVARPRGKQTSPPAPPANLRLQPLRVAAPRPSVPSAFFSVTTVPFKLPSLPGSKRPPSTLPQAHTSAETDFLDTNSGAAGSAVNSAFLSDAQAIISGSAVDAHKPRPRSSSHARMLGKIVETDLEREMELELESQSQSHEGVLEHPFGSSGPGRLVTDHPMDAPVGEGRPGRTLKRSKKSFSFEGDATRDGGEEEDYGTLTKRFKADDTEHHGQYSQMAPPHEHQHHQQEHQHQQHQRQSRRQSRGPAQQQPRPTALELLFGVELDAYIAAHQEEYDALQKKWNTCSLEEWQAGAGELGHKFSAVLDFVRDNMLTKLNLWKQIDTTIASHKTVLAEREKVLAEVGQSLVQGGGAVIGMGAGEDEERDN